ncbi:MAG TPA: prepilin peptidase [Acidimicrobiia bacterium]|jgi:leader peptidase (prepilin peptidase)/N-methyltransferase
MTTLLAAIAALSGLAFGSFIHVVARRVPAKLSVVAPGSRCPLCEAPVRPRDNIPVLSYLILRGRCRDCGRPIGWRYPAAEIATAGLFAATVVVIGTRWVLPAFLWFAGVTMALMITDLDHKLIPNRILFPGTAIATALLVAGSLLDGEPGMLLTAIAGAVAFFAILLALALVARGGFGYGDVKLGFLLGMFLGYERFSFVLAALLIAFFAGGIVSLLLVVTRLRSRKDAIPFGPYLILATYVVLARGPQLIDWYLNR